MSLGPPEASPDDRITEAWRADTARHRSPGSRDRSTGTAIIAAVKVLSAMPAVEAAGMESRAVAKRSSP